jgi:hypothetical protein
MRSMTRGLLALALLIGPAIGTAQAITIKEIVQYKGLGPAILISLIEADGSVFHLTAEDVQSLKDQGVPEQVILAMIDTGKPKSLRKIVGVPAPPDAPAPPAEPETPPPDDVTTSTTDAPPAPVVVNVSQHVSQHVDASPATVEVPVPVAVPVIEHGRRPLPQPQQTPSQQYWGYGGQKRPDSWGSTPPPPPQKDTKPDPSKKGGGSGGN